MIHFTHACDGACNRVVNGVLARRAVVWTQGSTLRLVVALTTYLPLRHGPGSWYKASTLAAVRHLVATSAPHTGACNRVARGTRPSRVSLTFHCFVVLGFPTGWNRHAPVQNCPSVLFWLAFKNWLGFGSYTLRLVVQLYTATERQQPPLPRPVLAPPAPAILGNPAELAPATLPCILLELGQLSNQCSTPGAAAAGARPSTRLSERHDKQPARLPLALFSVSALHLLPATLLGARTCPFTTDALFGRHTQHFGRLTIWYKARATPVRVCAL
jgi:hypothetical protein